MSADHLEEIIDYWSMEWNSTRLSHPVHCIVTKSVHKTVPGGGVGRWWCGSVVVGVGGGWGFWG